MPLLLKFPLFRKFLRISQTTALKASHKLRGIMEMLTFNLKPVSKSNPQVQDNGSLHKIERFMINLGFVLGTHPIKFDNVTWNIGILQNKLELVRLGFGNFLIVGVKLILIGTLSRDIYLGKLSRNHVHLFRVLYTIMLAASYFFQFYLCVNRKEVIVFNNSVKIFYQDIHSKRYFSSINKYCAEYLELRLKI